MIRIDLDSTQQKRLDELAKAQGQDGAALARRIVLDHLDFEALPHDSDDARAEASIALVPEIMDQENWDDAEHGSQ